MSYRSMFQRPLNDFHRATLLRFLGLAEFRFRYVEIADQQTLRDLNPSAQPTLIYDHGKELQVFNGFRQRTAWSQLLPFPWSLLAPGVLESDSKLYLEPADFLREVEDFRQALHQLEEAWAHFEIVVLSFSEADSRFHILLHLVRRQCLYVGLLTNALDPIAIKFENQQLKSEDLAHLFGTQTAFFSWKKPSSVSGLSCVSQQLLQLAKEPAFRCEHRLTNLPNSQIGL